MIRRSRMHDQPPPIPPRPESAAEPPRPVAVTRPVPRKPAPPRLPDASTFGATYDGDTESWSGQLLVRGERFRADARTLYTLVSKLDDLYRKSLKGSQ